MNGTRIHAPAILDVPGLRRARRIKLDVADGHDGGMLVRARRVGQRIALLRDPVHMMGRLKEGVRHGAAAQEPGI